jgi:hypothetical protein
MRSVLRVLSFLRANCPDEVAKFWQDEFLQSQLASVGRAGQAEDDFPVRYSRKRTAHHRCAANFVVTQLPEQFAETFKPFIQQRFNGFNGYISRRCARASRCDNSVNFFVSQPIHNDFADLPNFVADNLVSGNGVTVHFKQFANQAAARVGFLSPSITDCQDGASDGFDGFGVGAMDSVRILR